jgi:hypothetical protein
VMPRYVKSRRGKPTDEIWLSALIVFGPFAYVARWIWRPPRELA